MTKPDIHTHLFDIVWIEVLETISSLDHLSWIEMEIRGIFSFPEKTFV